MANFTELTGHKVMIIKLLKQELTTDEKLAGEDVITIPLNGSTCENEKKENTTQSDSKKSESSISREDFVPKGAIVREGRIFFAKPPE